MEAYEANLGFSFPRAKAPRSISPVETKVAATKYPRGTVKSTSKDAATTASQRASAENRANPTGERAPRISLSRGRGGVTVKIHARGRTSPLDIKTAFLSTRPWSFSMTFSSVTMGALMAAVLGKFDPALYLLTLAGMTAFHAATNVLNDFFDVKHGVDMQGAPTTKYRLHPAAFGQTPLSTILGFSVVLYGLTLAAGIYLAFVSSLAILVITGLGIAGSVFYTADPVVLKARALGEATVFVMWGLLIPLGAFVVQTGTPSLSPVMASLPVGLLVALVLLANNIRDEAYDGSTGSRTLAVVLGGRRASELYSILLGLVYVLVLAGIVGQLLPVWSLLVLLTVPEARGLTKMFDGAVPDNADPRTAALALKFAILYIVSLVLSIFFPLAAPV
jgi:1,4-dihydroxy-2-naphthoate polyprenyltransferase